MWFSWMAEVLNKLSMTGVICSLCCVLLTAVLIIASSTVSLLFPNLTDLNYISRTYLALSTSLVREFPWEISRVCTIPAGSMKRGRKALDIIFSSLSLVNLACSRFQERQSLGIMTLKKSIVHAASLFTTLNSWDIFLFRSQSLLVAFCDSFLLPLIAYYHPSSLFVALENKTEQSGFIETMPSFHHRKLLIPLPPPLKTV